MRCINNIKSGVITVMEKRMKKFDKEYSTQWIKEVEWLKEKGIRYTFVKTDKNNLTTYKYKKTTELFNALSDFYK